MTELQQEQVRTRIFDSFEKAMMYCLDITPIDLKVVKQRLQSGDDQWVVQYISSIPYVDEEV
jgi:hypothetical protein